MAIGPAGVNRVGHGLYRLNDPFLGECARFGAGTGDGAPYMSRAVYKLMGCNPPFEELPARSEPPQLYRQSILDSLNL